MICGERLVREGPELLLVVSTHGWRKALKTVRDETDHRLSNTNLA